MTKLPSVSGRECAKALGTLGFELRRQEGSHMILRRADPFCQVGGCHLDYVWSAKYGTYMSKLTLSVDEDVVARAKRYAAGRGTSVSWLVERYLSLVSRPASKEEDELPPILAQLRAEWKGVSADRADYYRYLERKYR